MIDETWDLTRLYSSFESDEFKKDYAKIQQLISDMNACVAKESDPLAKILEYLNIRESISQTMSRLAQFASLTYSTDTKNLVAKEYANKFDAFMIELTPAKVTFQRWIGHLDNFDELIKDKQLTKYVFFLTYLRDDAKHLLSDEEELLAAQLSQSGSLAWENLFSDLWSSHLVPIEHEGKAQELPLAQVRNFAYDKDPATRKKGYDAELAAYHRVETGMAAALNGIKGESLLMSKKRGFASVLDEVVYSHNMKKETLDAMLSAMKKALPAFEKYLLHKSKLLGHSGGLPFYDLFAPIGEAHKSFPYEETKEFILKHFGSFSTELADFAKNAFDTRWIDLRPRKGKVGGGFCASVHAIRESRILINSTDCFDDLTTIAHELGHAFHNSQLYDEPYVNKGYPMPLAETASIFCETIIFKATLQVASKEEKITYLENSIASATQTVVDILSRFIFESKVFEKRQEHAVSVDSLKDFMLQAQKEAYGKGLDHTTLHPYMWACKPHYYGVSYNFYNFPYAFGLLFAKGLYTQYVDDKASFVTKYNAILNASGKMTVEEVGKLAGVDLSSSEFWEKSLGLIQEDIEEFIRLTS